MTLPAQPAAAAGLPVQTPAVEPSWVRNGSSAVKQDYAAALQFEQMLVAQLASSLSTSGEAGGESSGEEGGGTSEPGASVYSSMLPQAMASSVVGGGGLGLAAELTRQLAGNPGASPATGGTSAA